MLVIALGALILFTVATAETPCWQQYSTQLPQPLYRACPLWLGSTAYLVGGATSDSGPGGTQEWTVMDLQGHQQWLNVAGFVPFAAEGGSSCATVGTSALFVSQAAVHIPAVPAEGGSFFFRYDSGGHWTPLAFSEYQHHKRCRAGFVADDDQSGFLFGGLDETGNFASDVLLYNSSTNSWAPFGSMQIRDEGFCDCVPLRRRHNIYVVCQSCTPSPLNATNITILEFNRTAVPPSLTMLTQLPLPQGTPVLAFAAQAVAQFIVVMVDLPSQGDLGPAIWYYDIVLKQINFYAAKSISSVRYGGAILPTLAYMLYLGGRDYSVANDGAILLGNVSNLVDTVRVLPPVEAIVDTGNYTFNLLSSITVQTDTATCTPSVRFRLASSIDCQTPASPSIPDTGCGSAVASDSASHQPVAVFLGTALVSEAYLCLSLGTCAQSSSSPCPVEAKNFGDCHRAACCWDAVTSNCYAYTEGVADENMFFFNVDPHPISIVNQQGAASPPTSFFRTRAGVITISVCAAIIVVIAVAIVAYFQRKPPELEHPLENNSKYRLISKLGQGGFGTVFLVQRKSSGPNGTEQFAMKYIACQSEEDRHYAMKEFELIRNAQGHPNMIRLVDMFMSWSNEPAATPADASPKHSRTSGERQALLSLAPRYVCIVMDYFPEGDLANYILEHWRQGAPEHFVLHVVCKQVCTLLRHLHALNPPIVHRDLKPENVLLADTASKVVVTDFGLAQQVEKSYMTTRAGSLHYVAPECWKRHYTAAVDMWGLGCIMYAACTGRVTADTARVMFSDARDKGFERDIRYDLRRFTPLLVDIVVGLLQVDPNKRLLSGQVLSMLEVS